jgi:hypothetical protein
VNVTLALLTVPSLLLELESGIVTLAVGAEFNTIVKLAESPDSEVISPVVGVMVIPPGTFPVIEAELETDLGNLRRYERYARLATS